MPGLVREFTSQEKIQELRKQRRALLDRIRSSNPGIERSKLISQLNQVNKVLWAEDEGKPYKRNIWENAPRAHLVNTNNLNDVGDEEYSYPHADDAQLTDWEDHEATLGDKTKVTQLYLEPNKYRFKDNKLVIKKEDYPNLKTLYACGLGLEAVDLDCPSLENLYLTNNKLQEIDTTRVLNLRNLFINSNQISSSLDFKHLKNLEDLRCNNNSWIEKLDFSGLTELRNVDCSDCGLENLNAEKCINLRILDADLNSIEESCFDFPPLPELLHLSLFRNVGELESDEEQGGWKEKKVTLTLRSPKLRGLVLTNSNVGKVIHALGLEGKLNVVNDTLKKVEQSEQEWQQHVNEHQHQTTQERFDRGETVFEDEECWDMSHWGRTKMELDGSTFPQSSQVKSINLGHNNLHTLSIKNFPNLARLILTDNAIIKEVKVLSTEEYQALLTKEGGEEQVKAKYCVIVNCPKLNLVDLETDSDIVKTKSMYGHNYNDPSRQSEEEREYNDELDNKYRQQTLLNDLLTNPQQHTYDEWKEKINFEQVPPMQRGELIKALQERREKENEEQEAADRLWWENYEQELATVEEEAKQLAKEEAEETPPEPVPNLAQAQAEARTNIQQLLEENDLTASDLPPSYQQWEQQLQTCHSPEELQALQQQLYQAITEPTPVASSRHTVAWWGGLILSLFLVGYGLWRKLESDL